MAAFPSYAHLVVDGYDETADYSVLRTDMDDGGPAKQRPRRTLPVVTRNASLFVGSLAERQAFIDWMKTDLSGGTDWFDWNDPADGATKRARIVSGKVTWTSPGGVWLGKIQLETIG
jgi:hypothetical protein